MSKYQVIKESIAYRAKYRLDQTKSEPTMKVFAPPLCVPHFKNRGGDPVRSIRTMQLSGDICSDGCDTVEANSNAVAVAQDETHLETSNMLQSHFEGQISRDPDMAAMVTKINALIGTLSHSNLNCMMRNMLCGMKGCECVSTVVEGAEKKECSCKNKPILDKDGCYSMELVKAHDPQWGTLCNTGIVWELLTPAMDKEEPQAAMIISVALNKKNEAAMKTAHTEIMKTLTGLCKPDPHDVEEKVPFEPVKDRMIELYGAAVDHPDFKNAFQLVLDTGGHSSPHMKDLHEYTDVFVNPKLRKMRFEAYAVVSPYPTVFPRIKIASLKWAWKQIPKMGGWCELPPSIAHRLASSGTCSMSNLMLDIEDAFSQLGRLASTVVEKSEQKKKVKWISEVEINTLVKVFAVPKKDDGGLSVSEQEERLAQECAEIMAAKLITLDKSTPRASDGASKVTGLVESFQGTNSLLRLVLSKLKDSAFVEKVTKPGSASSSTVVEDLVPKVIKLDSEGNPTTWHEREASAPKANVEVIDCEAWQRMQAAPRTISNAKALIFSCTACVRAESSHHVAIVRQGGEITSKAKCAIEVGALQVPLGFGNMGSIVAVAAHASTASTHHPHAVTVEVSWKVSEKEKEAGFEKESHVLVFKVNPEFHLPKARGDPKKPLEWEKNSAAEIFWGIKRMKKEDDEWNCEIRYRDVVPVVAAMAVNTSNWNADPVTDTFTVRVPYIVNTHRIDPDKAIVLKWQLPKKVETKKRPKTWVDVVQSKEKKR